MRPAPSDRWRCRTGSMPLGYGNLLAEVAMIESVVWGAAAGLLALFFAGIRRLPWRYCAIVGVGFGVVHSALRFSMVDADPDPSLLVLIGAIGGSVATSGFERGEREQRRRSAAILGTP